MTHLESRALSAISRAVHSGEARAFPWHLLPATTRASVGLQRQSRDVLESLVDAARLPEVVRAVFAAEVSVGESSSRVCSGPLPSLGADLKIEGTHGSVQLSLHPALVAHAIGRVLGKSLTVDAGQPLTDSLRGALAAISNEVLRRLARTAPPAAELGTLSGPLWQIDFWLRLDGVSFPGRLGIRPELANLPRRIPKRSPSLELPVRLPLIVGRCSSTIGEIASLRVGDGFLFADGESPNDLTTLILCAPGSDRGLELVRSPEGSRLRRTCHLRYESERAMTEPQTDVTVEETVLEAPVEVRIEMGSVSLSAGEWLALQPGDVVVTEIPLGAPVVLRVAGGEIARGSLISVDGKLGVKLEQLVSRSDT